MKGFGESLNRLWSAAARKGAARRQHASDSEAGGRILSSRPYWNASIDTILAFHFFLSKVAYHKAFRRFFQIRLLSLYQN